MAFRWSAPEAAGVSLDAAGVNQRRRQAVSEALRKAEEQALVLRAQAGDRTGYEMLVRHNADRLYAVVLRLSASEADAEEATQEAFLRA